ncbi:MAG: App1 family protein, partial [Gammaproteobacteria bacterium]|nr:App1 family protein [Gammaproteobacteria bacterium]MDX5374276.1 App1 family protein [Gammaproteobacteria bacterium]
DSGEQDPEVYAEMARRHPGRVLAIVIRDVGAVEPAVADARYAAAWDGLEDVALYRFAGEVPDALRAALLALVTADEPIP